MAQTVIWTGTDPLSNVSTNWSDANNWAGGIPWRTANICFFDTGVSGAEGSVNNIVDGSTTILSLEYGNTNGFHTTQIDSGVTLIVSNNSAANLVVVGTGTDDGQNETLYATITGSGSLAAVSTNIGSVFSIQQGSENSGSHMATLDLSGLPNFNLTAGRLLVGGAGGTTANNNRPSGTFYLAGANTIRLNGAAPAIDAGYGPMNGGTEYLYLGESNTIFADSMTIAGQKCTATLAFNPAIADGDPVFNLNGNTSSRVTTLSIGDFSDQSTSGSTCFGTVNLTGGNVNAQVNTCNVGLGQTGSGTGTTTGILSIAAGLFNINQLNVGYAGSSGVGAVTGMVNVTNGTLVVNSNLVLGYNPRGSVIASGTLTITNGTVFAANIISGGGNSEIKMSGGLLTVSNTIGSPSAPLSSLTLDNGATLQLWVANDLTNAATTGLYSDNTGVIDISALPTILAYPSQFPLIACPRGAASGITFAMGTLPGAFKGYISNDNSSTIWLVITNGPALPKTDQWGGAVSDNWDTTTLNWTNNQIAVAYSEGDFVLFNDTAQTGAVNIVGTAPLIPYSWTVTNNVLNYTFFGTDSVAGFAGLIKSGGASLTLSERGDSFTGGITVTGGTVILNEPGSAISGGLTIASGATAQIGNENTNGALPSGAIVDNGSLVFSQTITNLVSSPISGTGSLTQDGEGILELNGTNSYSGDTIILQGTLALTGSGALPNSTNIIVSNATLDVSSGSQARVLQNLNMTNGAINVGATSVTVSTLNLGGTRNTINVTAQPGPVFAYPTNITLIQSANGINGYNFVLGSLPASFAGTLSENGNTVVLTLTSGPLAVVQGTISFAPTNAGLVLNPAFCGLSYEKSELTGNLFVSSDTSLVKMFSQIAPAVLRVGGNSVNTTCWGGLSDLTPITPAQVDAFAGFIKALPTNWHVIYGINMSVNNPTNCAAEAAYVANALGPSLLGFEIGNEPDLYYENGIRATNYTFADFVSEWRTFAAAITNAIPGWAVTNAGAGWTITGPASAGNTKGYTVPFATDEEGVTSMLTQHYYRANGQSPSSTLTLLLEPDTSLPGTISSLVAAADTTKLSLGFRMDECGSFYNGGALNVSDAYGTALWAIDFMFTCALNGAQGINFHGGGDGTGYTPIADNGSSVVQARPEFCGLKMFSLVSEGSVIPATLSLASNVNFTAYGVKRTGGGISVVLNNKATNEAVQVAVNLGPGVTAAEMIELTGPALDSTNDYTIGGAEIEANGSWAGGVQSVIPATNGQLTIQVPPISAILLNPILTGTGTNLTFSVSGNQLNLSWPSNYIGWLLQSNSLGLALSNDWMTVPGSASTNSVQITIAPRTTNVFFRMTHP
ncbi:MAG TPA: autotransporter-associated beta strand repeat-containing protein [Verrucomicrobiae bacterium]|jgi:autotransporter-associated beta strand protein|nr:autotransporter-associated beta strand repeat-containing protein [Verrucomicrobiae bacterium]